MITRRTLLVSSFALAALPARAEEQLAFDTLYKSIGVRGMVFSDRVKALTGRPVRLRGYMAPPLQAESPFFVLTATPLTICPFCQSDADWPVDIVVIYLRNTAPLLGGGTRLDVRGRLETGSWTDPKSGFVSLLRLMDAEFQVA